MAFPFLTSDRLRPLARHLMLGAQGEDIAAHYLTSLGYDLRGRNVRVGQDEIDLIAHDPEDDVLVFVEVRSREKKTPDGFQPEKTAPEDKRKKLRRSARRWVSYHEFDGGYRIDLVCVQAGRVTNHFKELSWG